ncbi:MAG: DUF2796 domain-containing protein [Bdellovibrionales bacterium]|nr:DUF2796 domain-containing protein [Bdellovibrionales bacterium]
MKFYIFIMSVLLGSLLTFSAEHEHRQHEAHVHGGAKLSIAFDNTKGEIEFRAAAEGVLGFEHQAKSKEDKIKLAKTISVFEKEITQMVKFEKQLACEIRKKEINMKMEKGSHHSDFIATYNVECNKNPQGTKLDFDFTQFNKLNDIDVVILIGDLQKSIELKKAPVSIELK